MITVNYGGGGGGRGCLAVDFIIKNKYFSTQFHSDSDTIYELIGNPAYD